MQSRKSTPLAKIFLFQCTWHRSQARRTQVAVAWLLESYPDFSTQLFSVVVNEVGVRGMECTRTRCPTPRGREVLWVCLAQEHNTITLVRARTSKELATRQRDSTDINYAYSSLFNETITLLWDLSAFNSYLAFFSKIWKNKPFLFKT